MFSEQGRVVDFSEDIWNGFLQFADTLKCAEAIK